MMVVRPARRADLAAIVGMVEEAGYGLTSLPKDAELLRRRVIESEESFRRETEAPGGETYLLVMEDADTGRVVGTAGIVSKVGGFEPFYSYRIDTHVYQSEALKVRREVRCLHLVAEHSGPCEIGSLYLAPEHRRHGNGRLLSLSRFLYMAEQPRRFEREVIAEMRGVVGADGRCPFWEALGRHFFDMEFPKADYLSVKDKRFIAELMPTHPVYIPLLDPTAQAVVGAVHPLTEPALKLLQTEGFRLQEMVDIFDGGPVVSCPLREIRTVRESFSAQVCEVREAQEPPAYLIGAVAPEFRVVLGGLTGGPEGVTLAAEAARALGVEKGDRIRCAPSRAAA